MSTRAYFMRGLLLTLIAFPCLCNGAYFLPDGGVPDDSAAVAAYRAGDYARAKQLWTAAAGSGDVEAANWLGVLHFTGRGMPPNWADAKKWYELAAERGSKAGQLNLGLMYQHGFGTAANGEIAIRWFQKAAEAGLPHAMVEMGMAYAQGLGAQRDAAIAVRWYTKAAEAGNTVGMTWLGDMFHSGEGVKQDSGAAVTWYRKAADLRFAPAQRRLGALYYRGEGVPKDLKEAVNWYQKGADNGDAWAQTNLADMYSSGQGVPKDEARSAHLFRKAADAGLAYAQRKLGKLYFMGIGVKKDPEQAFAWWQKAAAQGDEEAKNELAEYGPYQPTGNPFSDFTAAERRLLSDSDTTRKTAWALILDLASQGYAPAQYKVGDAYWVGYESYKTLGIAENQVEAAKWFMSAAMQGHAEAEAQVAQLYNAEAGKYMDNNQWDDAEANYREAVKWSERSGSHGGKDGTYDAKHARDMMDVIRTTRELDARRKKRKEESAARLFSAIAGALAQGSATLSAAKQGRVLIANTSSSTSNSNLQTSAAAPGIGRDAAPLSDITLQKLQSACGSSYSSLLAACQNPSQGQRNCYEAAAQLCDCYLTNAPSPYKEQHATDWQKCSTDNRQSASRLSR